jgi:tetrahydromethanopterin S-methyltransferase subunit A
VARLNDDAQWIVLLGFIVSFSFFFLALVINQSTVVGQTTAESVIEFPKNDIRDVRHIIGESAGIPNPENVTVYNDITILSMQRKSSLVDYSNFTYDNTTYINIHYNNGVTEYNERNWTLP